MTLSERIARAAARSNIPVCRTCRLRHDGAAWAAGIGWHDAPPVSPFTRRALAGTLPAAELGR